MLVRPKLVQGPAVKRALGDLGLADASGLRVGTVNEYDRVVERLGRAPTRALEIEALMAESAISWDGPGRRGRTAPRSPFGDRTVIDAALDTLERAWRTGFERHVT